MGVVQHSSTIEVDAEFEYSLPGGLSGRAPGVVMEPFTAQAIKHTDARLRAALSPRRS